MGEDPEDTRQSLKAFQEELESGEPDELQNMVDQFHLGNLE